MDKSQTKDVQDTMQTTADAGKAVASDMNKRAERAVQASQDAAQRGAEAMRDGAEQVSAEAERAMDRTSVALSASADYSRTMAQGFQTFAAEWLESSRTLAERTVERMTAIAQARNVVDLISAQRELVTGSFQDMLTVQQRVSSASVSVMTDAVQGARRIDAPLAA